MYFQRCCIAGVLIDNLTVQFTGIACWVQGDEDEENIIMPDLAEADLLVWFGDLNYRIDISHDDAMELIQRHQIDSLLTQDQLRTEMSAGRTFNGMREGLIRFVPSYKFDPGSQGFEYIYIYIYVFQTLTCDFSDLFKCFQLINKLGRNHCSQMLSPCR